MEMVASFDSRAVGGTVLGAKVGGTNVRLDASAVDMAAEKAAAIVDEAVTAGSRFRAAVVVALSGVDAVEMGASFGGKGDVAGAAMGVSAATVAGAGIDGSVVAVVGGVVEVGGVSVVGTAVGVVAATMVGTAVDASNVAEVGAARDASATTMVGVGAIDANTVTMVGEAVGRGAAAVGAQQAEKSMANGRHAWRVAWAQVRLGTGQWARVQVRPVEGQVRPVEIGMTEVGVGHEVKLRLRLEQG